jgi:hypothetical protein
MLGTIHFGIFCLLTPIENPKVEVYKTVISLIVLCDGEMWSPILLEEHRLRTFHNIVQRIIFGPSRDMATEG